MKKVLLVVLCAGLFFACGKKKQAEQTDAVMDTVAVAAEVIEEPVAEVVKDAVVEEPAQAASAKKTNTTAKKTNNNTGMTAAKANEAPSVKEHAESAANKVANKAIDKAEQETTNAIVNSGKKKR